MFSRAVHFKRRTEDGVRQQTTVAPIKRIGTGGCNRGMTGIYQFLAHLALPNEPI